MNKLQYISHIKTNGIVTHRNHHTYASQVPYLAGLNSILAKAVLLVMLFLAGGMVSGAWAADARCYVINNRGKRVSNFDTDNGSLIVPKRACSLFATNFRFYVSEEEAVKDAKG